MPGSDKNKKDLGEKLPNSEDEKLPPVRGAFLYSDDEQPGFPEIEQRLLDRKKQRDLRSKSKSSVVAAVPNQASLQQDEQLVKKPEGDMEGGQQEVIGGVQAEEKIVGNDKAARTVSKSSIVDEDDSGEIELSKQEDDEFGEVTQPASKQEASEGKQQSKSLQENQIHQKSVSEKELYEEEIDKQKDDELEEEAELQKGKKSEEEKDKEVEVEKKQEQEKQQEEKALSNASEQKPAASDKIDKAVDDFAAKENAKGKNKVEVKKDGNKTSISLKRIGAFGFPPIRFIISKPIGFTEGFIRMMIYKDPAEKNKHPSQRKLSFLEFAGFGDSAEWISKGVGFVLFALSMPDVLFDAIEKTLETEKPKDAKGHKKIVDDNVDEVKEAMKKEAEAKSIDAREREFEETRRKRDEDALITTGEDRIEGAAPDYNVLKW